MHGKMKEAQDGHAAIDDVEADTFARFCEYLYTGEYTAADHTIVLHTAATTLEEEDEKEDTSAHQNGMQVGLVDDELGLPPSSKKDRKRANNHWSSTTIHDALGTVPSGHNTHPWNTFVARVWPREPTRPSPAFRANAGPCEDYSEVFLSHARVYVFADRYDVGALRSLALHNLHKALINFTLHAESVPDIATLFRYVYQHTPEREGCIDQLRVLVIEYVACKVEQMVSNETFAAVLSAENSASVDLTKMILKRLR